MKAACVVLGTRPGIVKFAPVLRQLRAMSVPHFVVHSGQHYSENMDAVFFDEHDLVPPDYRVGSMRPGIPPGEQTAEMLCGIERVLLEEEPGLVLVGGDANTNLAGALAARKLDLTVAHVEAGLRSRDWRMPEEHNRVMIDHISDALFVSSERARITAEAEGVQGAVHVTGSTIGEALMHSVERVGPKAPGVPGEYVLATLHRKENVDEPDVLAQLVATMLKLPSRLNCDVMWPLHPRTLTRLKAFRLLEPLTAGTAVHLRDPVGHREFLSLLSAARLVVTDSGGVQQEACILGVPCVTARPSTEWTETVDVGANLVAGTAEEALLRAADTMVARRRDWDNPFSVPGVLPSRRVVELALELLSCSR